MKIRLTIEVQDKQGPSTKLHTQWFNLDEKIRPEELEKVFLERLREVQQYRN